MYIYIHRNTCVRETEREKETDRGPSRNHTYAFGCNYVCIYVLMSEYIDIYVSYVQVVWPSREVLCSSCSVIS